MTVALKPEILEFIQACMPQKHEEFIERCEIFRNLLFCENRSYNLTSIDGEETFWIKHVCDSIAILRYHPKSRQTAKIADIGAGAGFPSVPLAIALPDSKITAIDSAGKKTAFIAKTAEACEIRNLEPLNGRARELAANAEFQHRFDFIIARAVASASEIFREARKMLKPDGSFILYKTPESSESEICEIRKKSAKYGFEWSIGEKFDLPLNSGSRCFLHGIQKLPSPQNFARKTFIKPVA